MRHAMLDAAEAILREEGYGQLTSRRIAEKIEVKQRLVYYYFMTMDELIVDTFERLATRELERFEGAIASAHSLRQVWQICMNTTDTRLVSEFMALANRSEPLRTQVKGYIEKTRTIQTETLKKAIANSPLEGFLPAEAAVIFATSAAPTVHREAMLGIELGHGEVAHVIDAVLDMLDPV